MKILFFATKNFAYSNYLLNILADSGFFTDTDEILVLEQDQIVPGLTKLQGVYRYFKKSGVYFVWMQIIKKVLFSLAKTFSFLLKKNNSPYYPYEKKKLYYRKRISPFNNLMAEKNRDFIDNWLPDIIVSAFSLEVIPQEIMGIPKYGIVNIHPSLLPKYRGSAPVARCLISNDLEIGITLYYIDRGIDTGEIISQKKISTKNIISDHALTMECTKIGSDMLINFLNKIKKGEDIATSPNLSQNTKYYSFLNRDEIRKFNENSYKFFKLSDFFTHPRKKRRKNDH